MPVLLAHLALWHGVAGSAAPAPRVPAMPVVAALQVRTVEVVDPSDNTRAAAAEPAAVAPTKTVRQRPVRSPATQAPAPMVAHTEADAVPGQAEDIHLAAAATVPAEIRPTLDDPEPVNVPTYRTRLPSPTLLIYDLRRGFLRGTGKLEWRLADGQYQLRLEGSVAGLQVIEQNSQGAIDKAGIAPVRFTDRRRKGEQAANFRRDTNRITYSGPQTEYPLLPGTQDRLSWMVQLPAIVAADPTKFSVAGARVSMFVSGARGDADVWTFQVQGVEDVPAGQGHAAGAIKLVRESRKPHDTHVAVWLDPKRQYLPALARLTSGGDTLELVLLRTAAPS